MELIIILTILLISGILYVATKYYTIKQVVGFSMYPAFDSGDVIIIKKTFIFLVGGVYVFDSPLGIPCLKRLSNIAVSPTDGKLSLFFLGDNLDDSIDSRSFGFIDPSKVTGKVTTFKEEIGKWNL